MREYVDPMNTLVWIAQGLLSVAFLLAGGMKLANTKEKIIASGGKWAEDFSPPRIKAIGVVEVLCAIGVSVPMLLGHGHYSTSASAVVNAEIMVGAFVTHMRRKETPFLFVTAVLCAIALFVAYFRCPM